MVFSKTLQKKILLEMQSKRWLNMVSLRGTQMAILTTAEAAAAVRNLLIQSSLINE